MDGNLMRPSPLASLHAVERVEIDCNDSTYLISVTLDAGMTHLVIERRDGQPIHNWRDLQQIKNEIVGPEREAVELYPSESRLVDSANVFHLWALPAGEQFGFGFTQRRVGKREPLTGSVTVRKR